MATILITGASRGIGLAMAKLAAGRGDTVIATARDPGAAADLSALEGDVRVRALDVVDEASVEAFADATPEDIDLMVLNAGVFRGRGGMDAEDMGADAWREVLMTNVAGPFLVARAMLPNVDRGAGKRIAIVSSVMGSSESAPGNSYPYRTSKAAAANLARNLSAELAPRGIAVGAYHPGWVRTDMGGGSADISPEESAAGLMGRFDALSMDSTGVFEDWRGKAIPF